MQVVLVMTMLLLLLMMVVVLLVLVLLQLLLLLLLMMMLLLLLLLLLLMMLLLLLLLMMMMIVMLMMKLLLLMIMGMVTVLLVMPLLLLLLLLLLLSPLQDPSARCSAHSTACVTEDLVKSRVNRHIVTARRATTSAFPCPTAWHFGFGPPSVRRKSASAMRTLRSAAAHRSCSAVWRGVRRPAALCVAARQFHFQFRPSLHRHPMAVANAFERRGAMVERCKCAPFPHGSAEALKAAKPLEELAQRMLCHGGRHTVSAHFIRVPLLCGSGLRPTDGQRRAHRPQTEGWG